MAEWVRALLAIDIAKRLPRRHRPDARRHRGARPRSVVPVETTLKYVELIDGARHLVLPNTGHVGVVVDISGTVSRSDRGPRVRRKGALTACTSRFPGRWAHSKRCWTNRGTTGARGAAAPRAAVVFAHPHPQQGGTMHTKAVFQGAKGLLRIGCAVLRFNFRGVGRERGHVRRGPRRRRRLSAPRSTSWRRDIQTSRSGPPASRSASWIALETGAVDPRVSMLIGIAPPVNAAELRPSPNTLETTKPKFFVQGNLDELCPIKELWAFYAKLKEPKELVVIDGASHLFEGKTARSARRSRICSGIMSNLLMGRMRQWGNTSTCPSVARLGVRAAAVAGLSPTRPTSAADKCLYCPLPHCLSPLTWSNVHLP